MQASLQVSLQTSFDALLADLPALFRHEVQKVKRSKPRSGDRSFNKLKNLESEIDNRCVSSSDSSEHTQNMETVAEIKGV